MRFKKIVYISIGFIALAFGAVGAFIPIIPSVPFMLLAAFCFAKSSKKIHTWFTNTKLYKKNLEDYVNGKGMSVGAKIRIMSTVSAIMAVGFTVMMLKALYVPCIILAAVWVAHVLYFVFGIKTVKEVKEEKEEA